MDREELERRVEEAFATRHARHNILVLIIATVSVCFFAIGCVSGWLAGNRVAAGHLIDPHMRMKEYLAECKGVPLLTIQGYTDRHVGEHYENWSGLDYAQAVRYQATRLRDYGCLVSKGKLGELGEGHPVLASLSEFAISSP